MKQLVAVLVVLGTAAAVMAADQAAEFRAAADSTAKGFVAAFNGKDAAGVASFYADDAVALPPNGDMVKGKEAIQGIWKAFIDSGVTAKLEVVETETAGDLGFEVGKYTIMDGTGAVVENGKYVVVYKMEAGSWKMYRDIWNSSDPMPAPEESAAGGDATE